MGSFEELKNYPVKERRSHLLDDIFSANDIEDVERIPIFLGRILEDGLDSQYRIKSIKTIWGSDLFNPYIDSKNEPLQSLVTRTDEMTPGDAILFTISPGRMYSPREIVSVEEYVLVDNETVLDDSKDLASYARSNFQRYWQQIDALLQYHGEVYKKEGELEQILKKIEQAHWEYKGYLEFKPILKEEFPQGLEVAKEEYNELKTNLPLLQSQKEKYDRLQEDFEKLTKKIQDVIPAGKTLSDVLDDLEEYEANKDSIADALRLLRQQYDKSISVRHYDLDETILPDKSISSITFLKNSRLGFEYPDDVVKQFMSALATNQIITLFGKPGTGKTTFVREMAKALGARCSMVRVQNNWTDKSDIIGYYDPMHKVFNSTEFLEAILAAKEEFELKNYDSRLHFICLDEMNLARVEYYFAEFLSLLQDEQDQQVLALLPPFIEQDDELPEKLSRYRSFVLPPNVRFIGTINKDDSTNSLSPKVIDRSFFIELSSETYSEKKQVEERKGYYPLNFFTPDGSTKCSISLFENENGRFKAYMEQMYGFYKGKFGQKDDNAFVSFMILAKILPAVERIEDIRPEYNNPQYTLAKNRIDSLTPTNGGYIDYLGGN